MAAQSGSDSDNDTVIILNLQVEMQVQEVLPNLACSTKKKLTRKLKELGVVDSTDLSFVKAADLETLGLSPIEIRKAIRAWKTKTTDDDLSLSSDLYWNESRSASVSPTPSMIQDLMLSSLPSLSALTSTPTTVTSPPNLSSGASVNTSPSDLESSSTSSPAVAPVGTSKSSAATVSTLASGQQSLTAGQYNLSFDRFPRKMITTLDSGGSLELYERREFVRCATAELSAKGSPPGKNTLRIICSQIVSEWPSFQDNIDGQRVGSRYESLLTQMQNRIDNTKRHPSKGSLKRKVSDETNPKVMSANSYGCVHWQPELDADENTETQKDHMNELKRLFEEESDNEKDIDSHMEKSYPTQCQHINSGYWQVEDIATDWPFLFRERYFINHANYLLGKDVMAQVRAGYEKKAPKVWRFMDSVDKVKDAVAEVEAACDDDSTPKVIGLILVLAKYFDEDAKEHIRCGKQMPNDSTITAEDSVDLPGHPCLIAHGKSLTADKYSLAIEGVVRTTVSNPISAIAILFSSYYVFNLQYPSKASGPLEFIQRLFLGINPEANSKVKIKVKKGSRKQQVHGGLLKLTAKLKEFENEWTI